MACVVEMNEIENANSASSVAICILNGPQTGKHNLTQAQPGGGVGV